MLRVRLLALVVFAATLSAQPLPTYKAVTMVGQPDNGVGGPAVEATIIGPQRLTGDAAGNLYVAFPNRVFKIDAESGIYSRVAGSGIGWCLESPCPVD
jgi:hypothetical protein